MRILFFGGHDLGKITLEHLLEQDKDVLAAVMTETDNEWYHGLEEVTDKYNLKLFKEKNINDNQFVKKTRNDLKPDLIISVNFDQIFKKEIINIPENGCINIHASLLPKYRGRAPLNWAILKGEKETGVTVHYINEGIDTGKIILQEKINIKKTDYIADILEKVKEKYPEMINKAVDLIKNDKVEPVEQKKENGSYYGKRTPADGLIDWSQSAKDIYNLIRAVSHPYPGAFTYLDDEKLFIWRAEVEDETANNEQPGKIIEKADEVFSVQCGRGQLLVTDYETETEISTGDIFDEK
ncbi:methionyl-tRNA formyltransferase [Halanaerobium saccharolyticum]|uniref:Methionyl-tRNA formyltransferase n=1 Tax=Halanaerobium saccharolyticum TaxID=43595 RepID=A0A4R6M412_9FIRM|nr:methionyl-tRNA formyltransferase [Halanaerobium saccharolyticum]TDO95230.1 methionyl-tRNA formyltransferase [Halanaerobium saccharolyticum]